MEETGFTLEGRVLCADDACIGTIGPDKRCKLCGRPYEGDAAIGAAPAETPPAGDTGPAEPAPAAGAKEEARDDGSPQDRTCCPDDACTGIIGPDGACGVCGKAGRG